MRSLSLRCALAASAPPTARSAALPDLPRSATPHAYVPRRSLSPLTVPAAAPNLAQQQHQQEHRTICSSGGSRLRGALLIGGLRSSLTARRWFSPVRAFVRWPRALHSQLSAGARAHTQHRCRRRLRRRQSRGWCVPPLSPPARRAAQSAPCCDALARPARDAPASSPTQPGYHILFHPPTHNAGRAPRARRGAQGWRLPPRAGRRRER